MSLFQNLSEIGGPVPVEEPFDSPFEAANKEIKSSMKSDAKCRHFVVECLLFPLVNTSLRFLGPLLQTTRDPGRTFFLLGDIITVPRFIRLVPTFFSPGYFRRNSHRDRAKTARQNRLCREEKRGKMTLVSPNFPAFRVEINEKIVLPIPK